MNTLYAISELLLIALLNQAQQLAVQAMKTAKAAKIVAVRRWIIISVAEQL